LVASLAIAFLLAQSTTCPGQAALIASAQSRAAAFNLASAADAFEAAVGAGCREARLSALYLRGWIAAREAYQFGGSTESLAPVRKVLDDLDALRPDAAGEAEIARFVLRAAMAAAQSERDEMSLLIDHAINLEMRRRAAALPGAPVIAAQEAAGDLWLQVHRYDDARRAYALAAERIGPTRRITLGLARAAVRMSDTVTACAQYQDLVDGWRINDDVPEIVEARAFLRQASCPAVRTNLL
jgi:hypothetical protein